MKYHIFFISFYVAVATATYLDDAGWILQARHTPHYLIRRGIIRAQHAATKSSQKESPSGKKSVRFQKPGGSGHEQQSAQEGPSTPSHRSQSPRKPAYKQASDNPRISLEAEGPAAMTIVRGGLPADFHNHPDTSTRRVSGEHPEKVIGMARSNTNPTGTTSQTLRGKAYGKGVSARVMVPPSGGSAFIRTETDHGQRTINVAPGSSESLTASSNRPRGAKVIAQSTAPGLVSFYAGDQRNFGDP